VVQRQSHQYDGEAEKGQLTTCSFVTADGTEMAKKIAMGHPNLRFDDSAQNSGSAQAALESALPRQPHPQLQESVSSQQPQEQVSGIREKARVSFTKASHDGSLAQSLRDNQDASEQA